MTEVGSTAFDRAVQRVLQGRITRTQLLAATGVSTLAALAPGVVGAQTATAADTAQDILNIAATAEALAVLFYTNALQTAVPTLKINDQDTSYLQAGLVEEQLHYNFLVKNGAKPLTTTFSLPLGSKHFTDAATFVQSIMTLETAFVSAYTAAIYEFSQMGHPDLARVAQMIAGVEAQHYSLGRVIGEDLNISATTPANNWAFAPQGVTSVGAAATFLKNNGFLNPTTGNSYTYQAVDLTSSTYASIAGSIMYQTPFVATS